MPESKSATYRIVHSTTYTYEQPVRVCHNIVMLTPRVDGASQPVNYRILVKPQPEVISRREDYFGNQIQTFSLEESHRQLLVAASGRVEVDHRSLPDTMMVPPWEQVRESVNSQTDRKWLETCQYRFSSPRIAISEEMTAYALQSFTPGRSILEAALELTGRVFNDFEYDSEATEVHTPTAEAFKIRKGVCQDFAHIQIGCLRSIGLCARYVSGYLRTEPALGEKKLIGADQSHAWISIYCGEQTGWVDLDPTNNKACDNDHIPIAWGRDYNDVIPVRGVFLGGGKHDIKVSVDVQLV